MLKSTVVVFGLIAVICMGCGATIRSSQEGMVRQHLIVTNVGGDPVPGTSVYVNDKHVGDTNEFGLLTHDIPGPHKGDSFKLKVNKSGYQAISRDVLAVVDRGFLTGDVFLGLIFGFIPIMFTLGVAARRDP